MAMYRLNQCVGNLRTQTMYWLSQCLHRTMAQPCVGSIHGSTTSNIIYKGRDNSGIWLRDQGQIRERSVVVEECMFSYGEGLSFTTVYRGHNPCYLNGVINKHMGPKLLLLLFLLKCGALPFFNYCYYYSFLT